MPSIIVDKDRVAKAIELLMDENYRETRIRNVLMHTKRHTPKNPFRNATAPLNYLVQLGRDDYPTLMDILKEAEKLYKARQATMPTSADKLAARKAAVAENVRRHRERITMIRKCETLKQRRLVTYEEAQQILAQYNAKWVYESALEYASSNAPTSLLEFRKAYISTKLKEIAKELETLSREYDKGNHS